MTLNDNAPMTCDALDAQLEAYLAGRLPEPQAAASVVHASRCARCEARLEAATTIDLGAFPSAVPDVVRARTMAAIGARTSAPAASRWRWGRGVVAVVTLAAAAALAMTVRRASPVLPPVAAESTGVAPIGAEQSSSPLAGATAIARAQAASEFQSLDAATQEIEAALKTTPDDRDMRAYLDAVRARRAELAEKVAEAAS